MTQNRCCLVIHSVIATVLMASPISAHSIIHGNRITIIKLTSVDFGKGQGRINESLGWRLGCYVKAPVFSLPASANSEFEVVVDAAAHWEATANSVEEIPKIFLAILELEYFDPFGNRQFIPQMLRPHHFGSVNLIGQTEDERSYFQGGSLKEIKRVVLGPIVIPAGAKQVAIGICNIAPTTTLQVHEIQIRFRPVP